jgi:hypothetical protein
VSPTGLAVLAALSVGLASAAQHHATQQVTVPRGARGLAPALLRRPWWRFGAAAAVGTGLQVAALTAASIIAVQTVMVSSLAWTTVGESLLARRRPGGRRVAAGHRLRVRAHRRAARARRRPLQLGWTEPVRHPALHAVCLLGPAGRCGPGPRSGRSGRPPARRPLSRRAGGPVGTLGAVAGPEDDATAGDAGGDPVCWLHRLCAGCGAVPSPDVPGRCWRCGAALAGADARPDDGGEPTRAP